MNRDTEFIIYLKQYVDHLNRIVRKLDKNQDLDDTDRDRLKFIIENFLKAYKEL